MANIIADIVEGVVRRDSSGWSATRVFDVSDVGGASGARPYNAAVSLAAQLGVDYGAGHPHVPGIAVSAINVEHHEREPDIYRISVEYRGDAEGSAPGLSGSGIKGVEVSTSTVRTRGFRDANGNIMLVVYQGPEVVIPGLQGGAFTPGTESQTTRSVYSSFPAEAEWDLPTVTVTITRQGAFPSFLASLATATRVNVSPWSGLGAHKWLSLGIDSTLNEAGSYDWRYIFAIAPVSPDNDTWKFRAENVLFYNAVRTQATVGNGIEFFDVYKPENFQSLFGFAIPHG